MALMLAIAPVVESCGRECLLSDPEWRSEEASCAAGASGAAESSITGATRSRSAQTSRHRGVTDVSRRRRDDPAPRSLALARIEQALAPVFECDDRGLAQPTGCSRRAVGRPAGSKACGQARAVAAARPG